MGQRGFPPGFFGRVDDGHDGDFYEPPRLVTHIDERAIAAVGELYAELAVDGEVLDLMSSWVSHFRERPRRMVALGMNSQELTANPQAESWVVHDLNADPTLPFAEGSFDDVVCCVSVDYLTRPVEVFEEVGRVLRPGGRFVVTFSNRCFPTKAIRGWLTTDDRGHVAMVAAYFTEAGCFGEPVAQLRTPAGTPGDPLYGVWAASAASGAGRASEAAS